MFYVQRFVFFGICVVISSVMYLLPKKVLKSDWFFGISDLFFQKCDYCLALSDLLLMKSIHFIASIDHMLMSCTYPLVESKHIV
ncbi:hypothetical protein M472_19630 [Sphingobacterium paucimobilis HER1398]|uniref:Uncharacterized protein n=1 Tax=Sphingobacterium paucimobilis HER1398 TaxID=1346330 RepID=U2J7S2_9SPHI|nr:hypothetical protein M472_19630 [Sphingobacterium paucimobilis HER1398]